MYIKGEMIGKCIYIEDAEYYGYSRGAMFECPYCGNLFVWDIRSMRVGVKDHCGCQPSKRIKHGMVETKIYGKWSNAIQRCTNKKDKAYKNYGGRGISVCDEWLLDFEQFYNHVSSLEYYNKDGYTLDRIDNDGNYEPGNVRWTTRTVQNLNKRKRCGKNTYTGVYKQEDSNTYTARVHTNPKYTYIGAFTTEEDAVVAINTYITENNLPQKIQELIN